MSFSFALLFPEYMLDFCYAMNEFGMYFFSCVYV